MKRILFASLIFLSASMSAQTEEEDWLQNMRPQHIEEYVTDGTGTHKAPRRVGSQEAAPIKSKGTKHVPVVLVNFSDRKFTLGNCDATPDSLVTDSMIVDFYSKFCNGTMDGTLYKGHGSYGSIRDYFVQMSDSVFFPEFDIIGPVTLNNSYAYYGKNSGTTKGSDVNYSTFYQESIQKAVNLREDWSDFDNDGNGTVDMVFLIYAGWGESNTGGRDPNALWAKESTQSKTVNGIIFATSACCQERYVNRNWAQYEYTYNEKGEKTDSVLIGFYQVQNDGSIKGGEKPDGIGVFIHELSHALGLPDFYDTNSKAFGMDLWSVMDYGEYGNNGFSPGGYTAYERDFMNWQKIEELTEPQIVTLKCFAEGGCGYKVVNPENINEYYILENRQPRGWDTSVCNYGHGLQVTHVDYSASSWNSNRVNTTASHQRMTIIAANNTYNGAACGSASVWVASLKGNLFPGDTYNYNLTDETTPAATVYTSSAFMHKPIRNITEDEDGVITLCYMTNGKLDTPSTSEVTEKTENSFTAEWEQVEYADSVELQLYKVELDESAKLLCSVNLPNDETKYDFTELPSSSVFKFRVKAFCTSQEDYLDSDWSDYEYAETDVDAIRTTADGEQLVSIYSMDGMPIHRCAVNKFNTLNLKKGIYVLKYDNGDSRKVMIK